MGTKSKFFRIATEGATCDGRTIERAWLEQMAKNYNPQKYGARINLEHIKGFDPNSLFKAYGDVIALKTEEVDGKLTLLAQIDPTEDLVALTKARQKLYTSCEIDAKFADTGEAYLVGLAITDSPASLGTEMLAFSAQAGDKSPLAARKQRPENLFSAAAEAHIEFEAAPGLLDKVMAMFSKNDKASGDQFAEVHAAVEAIAGHVAGQDSKFASTDALGQLNTRHEKLAADVEALRTQLSKEPGAAARPTAAGGNGETVTDC